MDYSSLSNREMDALVAERVMSQVAIVPATGAIHPYLKHYSTDDNAARLVRDRIAELGLQGLFQHYLRKVLTEKIEHICDVPPAIFTYMQATPAQTCIAALQALDAKEKP